MMITLMRFTAGAISLEPVRFKDLQVENVSGGRQCSLMRDIMISWCFSFLFWREQMNKVLGNIRMVDWCDWIAGFVHFVLDDLE